HLWDAASGQSLRQMEQAREAHSLAFAPDGKTLTAGSVDEVCIWDARNGKQLRKLGTPGGFPLAFSADGKMVAVGRGKLAFHHVGDSNILRLWDRTTDTFLYTSAYTQSITSIAFSRDSKHLAVGTRDGVLCRQDAVTGKQLRKVDKFQEPGNPITAISFSPDGKTLALGCYNGELHLLESSTGKELGSFTNHVHELPHGSQVWALAFSPSGRLLASGGADQTVRLWEVNAGLIAECHLFHGHDAGVTAVAFSPDGRRLASGSCDS